MHIIAYVNDLRFMRINYPNLPENPDLGHSMLTITLKILCLWLALNSYLAINAFLKFLEQAGFDWVLVLEIVNLPFTEWAAIMLLSALVVLGLSLANRMSTVSLFICLSLVGILILARRLLECSLTGSAEVFDIIYFEPSASSFDCILYALINAMMMFFKITYFVGMYFALKSLWNWLVKDRLPRAVLD